MALSAMEVMIATLEEKLASEEMARKSLPCFGHEHGGKCDCDTCGVADECKPAYIDHLNSMEQRLTEIAATKLIEPAAEPLPTPTEPPKKQVSLSATEVTAPKVARTRIPFDFGKATTEMVAERPMTLAAAKDICMRQLVNPDYVATAYYSVPLKTSDTVS